VKEHDKIKELFSEQLGNYSAPVRPELWNAIAAKVAVGSSAAATGTSLFVKSIIGISAASIIGVSAYFIFQDDVLPTEQTIEVNPVVAEKEVEQSQELIPSEENTSTQTDRTVIETVEKPTLVEHDGEIKEMSDDSTPTNKEEKLVSTYVPKERKSPTVVGSEETKNHDSKEEPQVGKDSKETETKPGLTEGKTKEKPVVYLAEITLLPNSFTPNGDRINDEFFIEFKGDLIDFNIVILDSQNRSVYESKDPNFRWNGINKSGEISPAGRYYYIVTARDGNGNPINQYNTLSIER